MKNSKFYNLVFILVFLFSCQKKVPTVKDEKWAFESLQIVQKVCQKIITCSKDVSSSNKVLNNIVKSNLNEKRCLEKYQKSNLFFIELDNYKVKENAKECFNYMVSISCNDFREKKFEQLESCKIISEFQRK